MSDTIFRNVSQLASADGRMLSVLVVPFGQDITTAGGQRERFEAGAFTRSVQERGSKIRLFAGEGTARVSVGRAIEWRETPEGLHAVFEVSDSHRGDDVLKGVREAAWTVGIRPMRERREGDLLIHTEAALMDVSVGQPQASAPQVVIPRSIAQRRLALLLLEREIG